MPTPPATLKISAIISLTALITLSNPSVSALPTRVHERFIAATVCWGAWLLGIIDWGPKWPDVARSWIFNNHLLATLAEEAPGLEIQSCLKERHEHLPYGEHLAVLLVATVFGLAHCGAGWQCVLLATLPGIGYGLVYRFGGPAAAIATHFRLNLLHFGLLTYPMLAG